MLIRFFTLCSVIFGSAVSNAANPDVCILSIENVQVFAPNGRQWWTEDWVHAECTAAVDRIRRQMSRVEWDRDGGAYKPKTIIVETEALARAQIISDLLGKGYRLESETVFIR